MEDRIFLNEAIAFAVANGKRINKTILADKLWPGSDQRCKRANISHLSTGKTSRISRKMVLIICEECGVTADFLFGIKKSHPEVAKTNSCIGNANIQTIKKGTKK